MIAALFRRRTWLRMADLVSWYRYLREQRRLSPIDLQESVALAICPHGVPRRAPCGLCAGLRWW